MSSTALSHPHPTLLLCFLSWWKAITVYLVEMEPESHPLAFSVLTGNLLWQHQSLKVLNLWLYLHLHGHCKTQTGLQHITPGLNTNNSSLPPSLTPLEPPFPKDWLLENSDLGLLVVLWLRLSTSNAGIAGLIPGQRTKIPHVTGWGQKKKKKHRDLTKLLSYLKSFTASQHHFQEKTQDF